MTRLGSLSQELLRRCHPQLDLVQPVGDLSQAFDDSRVRVLRVDSDRRVGQTKAGFGLLYRLRVTRRLAG